MSGKTVYEMSVLFLLKFCVFRPAEDGAYYTLVVSNLDINTRRNRTLAEFWHWFVANIPGDSVDDGEVIFDLLFPLVLPEGDGDHR